MNSKMPTFCEGSRLFLGFIHVSYKGPGAVKLRAHVIIYPLRSAAPQQVQNFASSTVSTPQLGQ
jgi:hypothetical protein